MPQPHDADSVPVTSDDHPEPAMDLTPQEAKDFGLGDVTPGELINVKVSIVEPVEVETEVDLGEYPSLEEKDRHEAETEMLGYKRPYKRPIYPPSSGQ